MRLSPEEREVRKVEILHRSDTPEGVVENRISMDRHDQALIDEMIKNGLIYREFGDAGSAFGYRLKLHPAGRFALMEARAKEETE